MLVLKIPALLNHREGTAPELSFSCVYSEFDEIIFSRPILTVLWEKCRNYEGLRVRRHIQEGISRRVIWELRLTAENLMGKKGEKKNTGKEAWGH